ncbi:MAG: D-alanyl-D-alanine carboxypeptidase [Clostridia bacterium]|nr:D-alanyl-D-alanine carboxypeptidase [Clostridia bacterium]
MKSLNKKAVSILLCLVLFLTFGFNVTANEAVTVSSECDISDINIPIDTTVTDAKIGQTLDIKAKSSILMEPYTGQILYESNADEVLPPASITKIMSLLLVMEAIDRKDLSLDSVISASEHACSMGGSQIWLEPNESMTVDDLLKAAFIASANDATVALGEAVAGSEEGFVAMMNEKAQSLGMTNTKFINCTGLDAEGHVTTAHDVAIMSCELIKHQLVKNYSTVWMDSLRDGKSELVNTNKLVRFYKGTTGLKTGTTSGAGYCLSATAQRNGMELVAVIMGGDTSNDRFNGAKKLLDYGFANYSFSVIKPELKKNTTVKVEKGTEKSVKVTAKDNINILLKKSDSAKITQKVNLKDKVTAPVKKGNKLGSVDVYVGDEQIGSVDITAKSDIKRMNFAVALSLIIKGLFVL